MMHNVKLPVMFELLHFIHRHIHNVIHIFVEKPYIINVRGRLASKHLCYFKARTTYFSMPIVHMLLHYKCYISVNSSIRLKI